MAIGEKVQVWNGLAVSGTNPARSEWTQIGGFKGYSFHAAVVTGAVAGTCTIELADDTSLEALTLDGSAAALASGTAYLEGESERIAFWARLCFTPDGTGSGTVSAVVSKWGP